MNELTARQKRFVKEYLIDLNATQAAIRSGYSKETAYSQGQRLLKKVEVKKKIEEQSRKQEDRLDLKADVVLKELLRIGLADFRKAFAEDGSLLPIQKIPDDIARAVAGVEVDEIWDWEQTDGVRKRVQVGETKKLKFWDKNRALENLGRHLQLWLDRTESTVTHKMSDEDRQKQFEDLKDLLTKWAKPL